MDVDRGRFLALVSAIAAAACGAKEPTPIVATPLPATTPSAAPRLSPPPIASAPRKPPGKGVWSYAPPEPPRSCSALKCPVSQPFEEGHTEVRRACRSAEQTFRPELFQRVVGCLTAPDVEGPCDTELFGTEPGQCFESWAEPPALDPSTEARCKAIVARCGAAMGAALTVAQCQGMLSVTRPSAYPKMIHCIVEFCDDAPRVCYQGGT